MSAHVRSTAGALETVGGDNATNAVSLAGGNVAVNNNYIIVIVINFSLRTVTSIADAAGTTYTEAGTHAASEPSVWYGTVAANNAGQSVVATMSGNTSDDCQVILIEVSGLAASQASLTADTENTTAATTHTSTALTPATAGDFMVAAVGRGSGTYTEDADFTSIATGSSTTFAGYIVNPVGATTLSFTSTDAESANIKTAMFVGAAAAAAPKRMLLLGVG